MIDKLNDAFSGLRATNESYFTGNPRPSEGIWLKGLGSLDSKYIDELTIEDIDKGNFKPLPSTLINEYLEARGWFIEPYDSGTMMAWRV